MQTLDLSQSKSSLKASPPPPMETARTLELRARGTVARFLSAVVNGEAREIACFGARGDGKTIGALMAMVAHAQRHQAEGFDLPVPWIGVTDTFQSHKLKAIRSLENSLWQGLWEISEGGHVAKFVLDGQTLVHLDLFGIEDKGAMDRVRMETCGIWFEEAAPSAVMVQSSGINSSAWGLAITSQRVPSYFNPAILTENYPDEDHWTWERFVTEPRPGTMYFRVPPGERADPEQRAEWARALRDRPDLERRLLGGEPGTVQLGSQVAVGFNNDVHVSKDRLTPFQFEPLIIGQDFGHTPTTVIGQQWRGFVRVYAALTCEHGGVKQHMEQSVVPWLEANAPWCFQSRQWIEGVYDPSQADEEADIEQSPLRTLEKYLPGRWAPGPVDWESRKGLLLSIMNRSVEGLWTPALQIDPRDAVLLARALSGRWYYPQDRLGAVSKDLPKKPNHPWEDLGDAFIYFLFKVLNALRPAGAKPKVKSEFSVYAH